MTALEIVCTGLSATHDSEFREAMRPELQNRMLTFTAADWEGLSRIWRLQSAEWQFNLCDTLSPTRHGPPAVALLEKLLLEGPESGITLIATKLLAGQALDAPMRERILARWTALPQTGPLEATYRQQLLAQVLHPDTAPAVAEAAEYSIQNREALAAGTLAACYYCQTVFPVSEITEYLHPDGTALCPYCGIDAVLPENAGYSFGEAQLRALNEFWFG